MICVRANAGVCGAVPHLHPRRFNADRMVMDYVRCCYVPAAGGFVVPDVMGRARRAPLATFADTGAARNEFFFSRVVALSAPARGIPYSGVGVGVRARAKSSGVTRPSRTFTGTVRPESSSCQMRAWYVPGGTPVIV